MKKVELEKLLEHYASLHRTVPDPRLASIQAAIFLEQALGVAVSDDDMTPERLGTPEAVAAFARDRAGTA